MRHVSRMVKMRNAYETFIRTLFRNYIRYMDVSGSDSTSETLTLSVYGE